MPKLYEKLVPSYGDFDIADTKQSLYLEKNFWKRLREKDWKGLESFLIAKRDEEAGAGFIIDPFNQFIGNLAEEVYWPGQFNDWCEAQPKSSMAFHIRGRMGIDYAWAARGGGFANTVSDEAFRRFHKRLLAAKADLEKAVALDPQSVHALGALITIHQGLSLGRPHFQLLQKVVEKRPLLLNAYVRCLTASFPKWGGSWEEAARVIGIAEQSMKGDQRWKSLIFDFHLERAYRSKNPAAYLQDKKVEAQLEKAYGDLVKAFPKSLLPHRQALRWAATSKQATRMRELRAKLGEMGHRGKLHQLSRCYAKGLEGYPKDKYLAFAFLRKAASMGGMAGASDMAWYYMGGADIIPRNEKNGMAWMRRSALLGSDWAFKQIISHYSKIKELSPGQLKDLIRVARWNYHRNRKGAKELLIQSLKKAPGERRPEDPLIPE